MDKLFSSRGQRKREKQLRSVPARSSEDHSHAPPEYLSLYGLQESRQGLVFYTFICILSCGIGLIVGKVRPDWKARILRKTTRSFRDATSVLVKNRGGDWSEIPVRRDNVTRIYETGDVEGNMVVDTALMIWFEYRKQRYIYEDGYASFQRLNPRLVKSCTEIHQMKGGLISEEATAKLDQNGPNSITIDVVAVQTMVGEKLVHPFYLFQMASVIIWTIEEYYTYAMVILVMSCGSIAWEIYTAKMNEKNLRNLVKGDPAVCVLRDGKELDIPAADLVVGDAVLLRNRKDTMIVADMALVSGECVLDESTLTGESVPVLKTQLSHVDTGQPFSSERHRSHTLFAGSTLTEVKSKSEPFPAPMSGSSYPAEHAIGVVIATGFAATKGELFRSILYPEYIEFKFYKDSFKFIAILGVVAAIAFISRLVTGIRGDLPAFDVWMSCLDLVTVAVPPALPLILTVGVTLSLKRMKKSGIFCIDPERINLAGRINIMAWDKTGTLTNSNLEWSGIEPAEDGIFTGFAPTVITDPQMERILATCHGLSNVFGQIVGHSVDLEMFSATRWTLENRQDSIPAQSQFPIVATVHSQEEGQPVVHILRRFDFDAHLQRHSVITCTAGGSSLFSYTKGSPEAIRNICRQESIPANFHVLYRRYASQGYYVLACAYKEVTELVSLNLPASGLDSIRRDQIERDLMFAGFILLQNRVKDESFLTIDMLKQAHVRSVIITGDNALTAVHIARQLKLCRKVLLVDIHDQQMFFSTVQDEPNLDRMSVQATPRRRDSNAPNPSAQLPPLESGKIVAAPDFFQDEEQRNPIEDLVRTLTHATEQIDVAITGAALESIAEKYESTFAAWLVGRARIFARATPNHKVWVIEQLKKQGNYVGMCGDGTNDCGALKAAHVGLALSDAEASIVAPFTSREKSVTDVEKLLREGRCALEISFTAFKYMIIYPIVQLAIVATLFQLGTNLSNNQFLFDDLAIVLVISLLMLQTKPSNRLTRNRPTDDLFSPLILTSIIGQVVINAVFFIIVVVMLLQSNWFCPVHTAQEGLDHHFRIPPENAATFRWRCYPIDADNDVNDKILTRSHENTSIWLFAHFQFVGSAFAYTITTRHRRPIWTNTAYVMYLLGITCLLSGMLLSLSREGSGYELLVNILDLREGVPEDFRFSLWCMAAANFVAAALFEGVFVDKFVHTWVAAKEEERKRLADIKRERSVGIGAAEEMQELDAPTRGPLGRVMSFGWRMNMGRTPVPADLAADFELDDLDHPDFHEASGSAESVRLVGRDKNS
ncbi:hypothetical protein DFS34DRAFT_79351 [Phlyctochytrium arcticum]|nr:hypothetical protein DFS34DRAFT_79351 [Phlyctochytrium arcticum]